MKNSYYKKIFTVLVLIFSLFVFDKLEAQTQPTYQLLQPLGNTIPQGADLSDYIPAVINLIMGVAAVLAFIMITFGGIRYATSDAIGGKEEGKKHIWDAVIGLLLVLGSYAILYTINPAMLSFDFSRLTTPSMQVGTTTVTASQGTLVSGCATTPTACVRVNGILQGYLLSEEEVIQDTQIRSSLGRQYPSIGVNNPACATGGTVGCTNVVGLPQNAISGLVNLNSVCSCNVMITGGTEGGHATHGPGMARVDLAPTANLNTYLARTNPQAANPVNGTRVTVNGVVYVYEVPGANGRSTGHHWHVSF